MNQRFEIRFVAKPKPKTQVIATAQEDIRAGDSIDIDLRSGRARRARFGEATAAQIGEQELAR